MIVNVLCDIPMSSHIAGLLVLILPILLFIIICSIPRSEDYKMWWNGRNEFSGDFKEPKLKDEEYVKGWYSNCQYEVLDKGCVAEPMYMYDINNFGRFCKIMIENGAKPENITYITRFIIIGQPDLAH